MGRGRRRAGPLGATLVLVLVVSGCGAEERDQHSRPPQPVAVTISISPDGVLVQPSKVGTASEQATNISQNEGVEKPEANPKAPLPVTFTISNITNHRTALLVSGAEAGEESACPVTACSEEIVPGGTGELKTALDTGSYEISARDIAGGKGAPFSVGPNRPSSQQDLLLP
jgi:hypothetical protein